MEPALSTIETGDATAQAREAPQGDIETALAPVWCEVLGLQDIGRDENFFELGGDSVTGMRLTELLATNLAIQIPVVELFQNPTVRELAHLLATYTPS